jgi:hypothetical protein
MVTGRQAARDKAFQLHQKGYSVYMIWKTLKSSTPVAFGTVKHWITALNKDGVTFLKGPASNKRGNPKAHRNGLKPLTRAEKFRAVNYVKSNPRIGYRRVPVAMKALGIGISKSAVHREAQAAGVKSFKPTPKITLKRYHKQRRLAFAQSREDFPWFIVSFTDDKTFYLDGSHNAQNERFHAMRKSDVPSAPKSKSLTNIKVHRCITSAGALPLVRLHKALKAPDFQRLLEAELPQIRAKVGSGFVYQHDLAGEFKAQSTQLFLQEHADDFFSAEEWPSRSPDFNPMEDQWAEMAKMVHEWQPKTKAQLDRCIQRAWKAVNTPERLQALYDSMPSRLREAIARKGDMTGHQYGKITI